MAGGVWRDLGGATKAGLGGVQCHLGKASVVGDQHGLGGAAGGQRGLGGANVVGGPHGLGRATKASGNHVRRQAQWARSHYEEETVEKKGNNMLFLCNGWHW